jgi:hypothetical protein
LTTSISDYYWSIDWEPEYRLTDIKVYRDKQKQDSDSAVLAGK